MHSRYATNISKTHSRVRGSMETIALLCLMNIKGVGRKTAWSAVIDDKFQPTDATDVHGWLTVESKKNKRIPMPSIEEVENAWDQAEYTLRANEKYGIVTISARDAAYPTRLKRISDPPSVVHIKGNAQALQAGVSIAVIGTREPTPFGREAGRRVSAFLACSGATIVSGLARGCDTVGHEGCLEAGGKTVAVLAHGLDQVHPRENSGLAAMIVERGGCLLSEYAVGTKPQRNYFVERDRIQSGLSDAVVVVETGTTGGTLHTAKFCIEQKRQLAVIKHTEKWLSHQKVQGNQMLLREGKAIGLADREEVNCFFQALVQLSIDNEHCGRWMDDAEERQLSVF